MKLPAKQKKPTGLAAAVALCRNAEEQLRLKRKNQRPKSDITSFRQAEEAKHRLEVLAASNRKLEQEIVRRKAAEESLEQSKQHLSRLLEEARQTQEQLRNLSHRILSAQEEERKRISRELHDVIAQMLAGINVRLAALKIEAVSNAGGLSRKMASTQRLVEKSVEVVHRFARELRPAMLDDLGLIPALQAFMKNFTRDTGLHIRLKAFAGVEKLSSARRTALYRITHEALTNVAHHAKASRVDVNIHRLSNAVCMEIRDDGKGFEPKQVLLAGRCKRLGLLGIRERVEMVGGRFSVESAPGKGTTICVKIPW